MAAHAYALAVASCLHYAILFLSVFSGGGAGAVAQGKEGRGVAQPIETEVYAISASVSLFSSRFMLDWVLGGIKPNKTGKKIAFRT